MDGIDTIFKSSNQSYSCFFHDCWHRNVFHRFIQTHLFSVDQLNCSVTKKSIYLMIGRNGLGHEMTESELYLFAAGE